MNYRENNMPNDETLHKEVSHLLRSDPGLNATHIVVAVHEGTVILSGEVHSYTAKWMAKEAVKHVHGIKEIKDNLQVCPFEDD